MSKLINEIATVGTLFVAAVPVALAAVFANSLHLFG